MSLGGIVAWVPATASSQVGQAYAPPQVPTSVGEVQLGPEHRGHTPTHTQEVLCRSCLRLRGTFGVRASAPLGDHKAFLRCASPQPQQVQTCPPGSEGEGTGPLPTLQACTGTHLPGRKAEQTPQNTACHEVRHGLPHDPCLPRPAHHRTECTQGCELLPGGCTAELGGPHQAGAQGIRRALLQ